MGIPLRQVGIPLRPDPGALRLAERRSFMRAAAAKTLAKLNEAGRGTSTDVLKSYWRGDDDSEKVLKAISDPPFGTSEFWAAQPVVVLPTLAPAAAATKLMSAGTTLSLTGVQTVKLPYIGASGRPVSVPFVAEGMPGPAYDLGTNSVVLGPVRKLLIFAALTEELEAASGETASQIIGDALNIAATQSMDACLFSSNAATAAEPAGILYGVAPLPASGGTGFTGIADDLALLAEAIATAGINPETMMIFTDAGSAMKLKVLAPQLDNAVHTSVAIPSGTVIAVVPEGFATGYGSSSVSVEVVKQAEIHFEDTSPQPIVDSSGVVAKPVRSLFQQAGIGLKVRGLCTWSVHPGAVAWLQGCDW